MTPALWHEMVTQAKLRRHGIYTIGYHMQSRGIVRYRLHLANMEARFGVGCLTGIRPLHAA